MSAARVLPLGSVIVDIAGYRLTPAERTRLLHPAVGGMILFSRNFESPQQLVELTAEIHTLRQPPLLISVDHEGGRVQRFRDGFTVLPAMRELGAVWDAEPSHAKNLARQTGYVLASELRACGVDLSFTPVLDIDFGNSSVIGDRAFHRDPAAIAELAIALMHGLQDGQMSAVGKHFPGHGHVRADSHHDLPVDPRPLAEIESCDLVPFRRLIENGLGAIMPAHVVYPQVDDQPAGFSAIWLEQILRRQLGFDGLIFSDDLSMEGARAAGGVVDRAHAAFDAGCDMVLVCNDAPAAERLLEALDTRATPAVTLARLARIHGRGGADSPAKLRHEPRYLAAAEAVRNIGRRGGELPLSR
jgi:beta-N-acetylhexosaminidase